MLSELGKIAKKKVKIKHSQAGAVKKDKEKCVPLRGCFVMQSKNWVRLCHYN